MITTVYKAASIAGSTARDMTLKTWQEVDTRSVSLEDISRIFERDAERVVDFLAQLPQGTQIRVLGMLLNREAGRCYFVGNAAPSATNPPEPNHAAQVSAINAYTPPLDRPTRALVTHLEAKISRFANRAESAIATEGAERNAADELQEKAIAALHELTRSLAETLASYISRTDKRVSALEKQQADDRKALVAHINQIDGAHKE